MNKTWANSNHVGTGNQLRGNVMSRLVPLAPTLKKKKRREEKKEQKKENERRKKKDWKQKSKTKKGRRGTLKSVESLPERSLYPIECLSRKA